MTIKEKIKIVYQALDEKKGEDITIIDISEISVLADYFIIAGGSNKNQVQAMVENVEELLKKEEIRPTHIEGYNTANWILLDYEDFIVHVFDREDRFFYDLERIWKDGKILNIEEL